MLLRRLRRVTGSSGESDVTHPGVRVWQGIEIPAPGIYKLDPAHRRIGFRAQHMMVSPVRGEFTRATARIVVADDPLASYVTATIEADSISTGYPDRDAHLRSPDFLDVEKYPTLEYRSTGMRLQADENPIFYWARLRNHRLDRRDHPLPEQVQAKAVIIGELTIKGVTRPVNLHLQYGGARRDPSGQEIFGFSATAEIDREDFGLLWNVVLETGGVLVGKKVHIEIAGEAIRQS